MTGLATAELIPSFQGLVGKVFLFEAAHKLDNHKGKCAYLHGHSYKLEIFLKGVVINKPGESDDGFVMDFSDLSELIKNDMLAKLDHKFLNDELCWVKMKGVNGLKAVFTQDTMSAKTKTQFAGIQQVRPLRTTAENMALWIMCYLLTNYEWKDTGYPNTIRLWETASSFASITAKEAKDFLVLCEGKYNDTSK